MFQSWFVMIVKGCTLLHIPIMALMAFSSEVPICANPYYYLTYYMNGNTSFLTVSPLFLHIMKQLRGCQASH
jgi:hypothetical protein